MVEGARLESVHTVFSSRGTPFQKGRMVVFMAARDGSTQQPGGPKAAGTSVCGFRTYDGGRLGGRGRARILATLWNRPDLTAGCAP